MCVVFCIVGKVVFWYKNIQTQSKESACWNTKCVASCASRNVCGTLQPKEERVRLAKSGHHYWWWDNTRGHWSRIDQILRMQIMQICLAYLGFRIFKVGPMLSIQLLPQWSSGSPPHLAILEAGASCFEFCQRDCHLQDAERYPKGIGNGALGPLGTGFASIFIERESAKGSKGAIVWMNPSAFALNE